MSIIEENRAFIQKFKSKLKFLYKIRETGTGFSVKKLRWKMLVERTK